MEMFAFTLTEFADMLCLFHYARDFGPLYVMFLYSLLLLTLCFLQKFHWSLIKEKASCDPSIYIRAHSLKSSTSNDQFKKFKRFLFFLK